MATAPDGLCVEQPDGVGDLTFHHLGLIHALASSLRPHGSLLMTASPAVPNNLGPTLLILLGFSLIPLLLGLPILLYGLSQLRSSDGRRTYQHLFR
jgi:hypothetical protein